MSTYSALDTDFYQITMGQVYFDRDMDGLATFSLFAHNLPQCRGYLVAAGLEYALDYLEAFRFNSQQLEYLGSLQRFSPQFLDHLAGLSFKGQVRAVPEGTVVFAGEPILEVTAPLSQAQLVETHLIRVINLHSTLAGKAARCALAAGGRICVDFSLRRCQGRDAGMAAARSSLLAGFASTSNVDAARLLGVPPVGTMAHSFIEAFGSETEAFEAFAQAFPDHTVTLVDTYDSIGGLEHSVELAAKLKEKGKRLLGIRLDSGDLVKMSKKARSILDQAGLKEAWVVCSGSLDEYRIHELLQAGAAIDMFAVGTRMGSSADAPYLDLAYKLVAYDGRPTMKLSSGKQTYPGAKQIWRTIDADGRIAGDMLGLIDEDQPGESLLHTVMSGGKPSTERRTWQDAKKRFAQQADTLPETCRWLSDPQPLTPGITPRLQELTKTARKEALAAQAK